MIHDRFYSKWEQPIGLTQADQRLAVILKIRIRRDGTIAACEIVNPSGNAKLDESVLSAANRVQQIDPLPAGLPGENYELRIKFELDQR